MRVLRAHERMIQTVTRVPTSYPCPCTRLSSIFLQGIVSSRNQHQAMKETNRAKTARYGLRMTGTARPSSALRQAVRMVGSIILRVSTKQPVRDRQAEEEHLARKAPRIQQCPGTVLTTRLEANRESITLTDPPPRNATRRTFQNLQQPMHLLRIHHVPMEEGLAPALTSVAPRGMPAMRTPEFSLRT